MTRGMVEGGPGCAGETTGAQLMSCDVKVATFSLKRGLGRICANLMGRQISR
jgi:hypothetical protein